VISSVVPLVTQSHLLWHPLLTIRLPAAMTHTPRDRPDTDSEGSMVEVFSRDINQRWH
jgi:hypothetical protein